MGEDQSYRGQKCARPRIFRVRRAHVGRARPCVVGSFGIIECGATDGFENIDMGSGWPEVGSRMMTRVLTGQDLLGEWVIVQDGVYRYSVVQQGVMLVRTVLFEYLATETYWTG